MSKHSGHGTTANLGMIIAVFVTASFTLYCSPAMADECTDTGLQATMLGMLDSSCVRYKLTETGQSRFDTLIVRSIPLGGERCAPMGKMSMVQKLATPTLEVLAASGDEQAFNAELCELIAKYMMDLAIIAKKPPIFERRK
jgi:hypothetical protein